MTLVDLKCGEEGFIQAFAGESTHLLRLREMGLSIGTVLRVVRFAPFGDPIEIKLRGFHLSIRKDLARKIIIAKKV
jgi:Fe2+ transport system protein FeoA